MDNSHNHDKWNSIGTFLALIFLIVGVIVTLYMASINETEGVIISLLLTLALETVLHKMDMMIISRRYSYLAEMFQTLNDIFRIGLNNQQLALPVYLRARGEGLPDIPTQARNAKEIWVLFVTGKDLVNKHADTLRERCSRNCTLRVLLPKEDSVAVGIYEKWFENHKADIKSVRDIDEEVRKAVEFFDSLPPESAELKCLGDNIPFTMFITNPTRRDGQVVVGFQTYRGFADKRPYIYIPASSGSPWYKVFIEQYKEMWDKAQPVDSNWRS